MGKLLAKKANFKEISNHLIEKESAIRQIFFKGREAEIEGGAFEILSLTLKTALPSLSEYEIYEKPTYGPLGRLLIFVDFRIKKSNRWIKKQTIISDDLIFGFEAKETELVPFLRSLENQLIKLVNIMCENWREVRPFVQDFLNEQVVGKKIKLYMAEVNGDIKFYWVRSYNELAEYIGSRVGMVRHMNIGVKKDMVGEATQDDLKQFYLFGDFGSVEFLEEQLVEENKLLERQVEIKDYCA